MTESVIVIYRIGSLGDTIVALPCFNAVARKFPNSRRIVLTNVPVAANAAPISAVLGEDAGIVHDFIPYPVSIRSPIQIFSLLRTLRAVNADKLVYMAPSRSALATWRDWLFFRLSGFSEILAFPHTRDLRENRIDGTTGVEEAEAERLVRCFSEIVPIDLQSRDSWDLHLTPNEKATGRRIASPLGTGRYFAINMGGKAAQKDWGIDNWTELFRSLGTDFGSYGVLVVGADVDSQRAETLLARWNGPKVNACGKLSARESAAAMEAAELFVGHDSGPLHLAVASGVRSIGLFGDFNQPRKWHPIGKGVTVIHNLKGMRSITVDEVERAVRSSLATGVSEADL